MRPEDMILDIGCGDGFITMLLADRLPSGSVVGGSEALQAAARTHEQMVCEETLTTSYAVGPADADAPLVDLGAGEKATLSVSRA